MSFRLYDQPAAAAFRKYLDAHVPNNQDDRFFADNIIGELLYASGKGLSIEGVWSFLKKSLLSSTTPTLLQGFQPYQHALQRSTSLGQTTDSRPLNSPKKKRAENSSSTKKVRLKKSEETAPAPAEVPKNTKSVAGAKSLIQNAHCRAKCIE